MPSKVIRLTEAEVADLQEYLALTGETEASALKRAAQRGLKELRLEQAILAYVAGNGSSEAAEIAGRPRAHFLQFLSDLGVPLLTGPSTLAEEVDVLARRLESERLRSVAQTLTNADP